MLSIFNLSGGTAQSGRSHCSIQAEPLLNFAGRADFAERRTHLVDSQNLLKEETSLASFTAGFKLAWGLSKELEADGLYSFDQEETDRICRQMGKEDLPYE